MDNISICFCINDKYAQHLGVVLTSILFNNHNAKFKFYVLSSDISKKNKDILNSLKIKYQNFEINYIHIDKSRFEDFKISIDYISIETYYRYILADVIPNESKILYLDVDLIVNNSLKDLWNIDIKDYYCAAVKDINFDTDKYKKSIGLNELEEYINAGVILFNLDKIREDNITKEYFKNNEFYKDKISYQDQDIINITLRNKIKIIDNIYNFTRNGEMKNYKNAVIIHFVGAKKPWKTLSFNKLKRLYYYYYVRSPYLKINSFKNLLFYISGLIK